MINSQLINEPVTTNRFKIYDIDQLPKVILGIQVKSRYDEDRIIIKPSYTPIRAAHFRMAGSFEPVYLYGIEITLKSKYQDLLDEINNTAIFSKPTTQETAVPIYKNILLKYGLSCDECFGYLTDGMFPVDSNKLQLISEVDYGNEINSGFRDFIDDREQPWYVNLCNFNIYIICESLGYSVDLELNTLREKK